MLAMVTSRSEVGLPAEYFFVTVPPSHCPCSWPWCAGTGVVTSVPSDSPDDFMALQDLKAKPGEGKGPG